MRKHMTSSMKNKKKELMSGQSLDELIGIVETRLCREPFYKYSN